MFRFYTFNFQLQSCNVHNVIMDNFINSVNVIKLNQICKSQFSLLYANYVSGLIVIISLMFSQYLGSKDQ